jgi:hypothetical protein
MESPALKIGGNSRLGWMGTVLSFVAEGQVW